jgi:PAS domain S-box-containing protein
VSKTIGESDNGTRARLGLPLRAYLGALLGLFVITAVGTIFVGRQLAGPNADVAVTVVSMAVLLVGTLTLYRSMMRPLIQLSDRMGQGTSALVQGGVVPSGPAEIARLALRFNSLVAAVQSEIRETGRAEALARASERNYRLLFDGNPQPLFVYDVDTLAFLEVNEGAYRRYGYTRDEFLALNAGNILTPDQSSLLGDIKSNPDLHRSGPWTHRSKDGKLIDVALTSIHLPYDGHDARLVVVEDLTERKKLERELQQSQRLETVGQLAGGIAHDFNNLVAVILNYADFVADELPDGDLRRDVGEIQRAAMRAADLTRQLLIFARREVSNPQVLSLNAVVAGVEKLLRTALGSDIALVLMLAEDLPSVRADPGQLEQVFLNLTVNARDAMPDGGRLVVETAAVEVDDTYVGRPGLPPGRYVRLSVSDSGIGMSADVAARAFEPFFTTKESGQGTGLGLATVYGIVTESGGSIRIYSEPGEGTRVSIKLPAIDEPASASPIAAAGPAIEGGAGRTVLVVEDEAAVLLAAVRILRANGYTVRHLPDPASAIAVLADPVEQIDILVTDVVMPGSSGVELARRALELRPGLPILYMSGYSQELTAHRSTLPTGSRVIQKPFTRRVLLEAVADTISRTGPVD